MDLIQTYKENPNWKSGDQLTKTSVLSKSMVHKRDLLHLSVHLLIINKSKSILCRRRSKDDLRYSGLWTTSIGTHVLIENDYLSTLEPLLPLNKPIDFIGEFRVKDAWENEINALYVLKAEMSELNEKFLEDRKFISIPRLKLLFEDGVTTPHLQNAVQFLNIK